MIPAGLHTARKVEVGGGYVCCSTTECKQVDCPGCHSKTLYCYDFIILVFIHSIAYLLSIIISVDCPEECSPGLLFCSATQLRDNIN